jgi:hypothetical protein
MMYLEADAYNCCKLDLPSVVSGLFSRLTAIIVALEHVNNYYRFRYFIIIATFTKSNFNFTFKLLDLSASFF